jgi:hypothetical protein
MKIGVTELIFGRSVTKLTASNLLLVSEAPGLAINAKIIHTSVRLLLKTRPGNYAAFQTNRAAAYCSFPQTLSAVHGKFKRIDPLTRCTVF